MRDPKCLLDHFRLTLSASEKSNGTCEAAMFVFSLFFLVYRTKICSSIEIDKDGFVSKVVATSFLISCVRLNEILQKWVLGLFVVRRDEQDLRHCAFELFA